MKAGFHRVHSVEIIAGIECVAIYVAPQTNKRMAWAVVAIHCKIKCTATKRQKIGIVTVSYVVFVCFNIHRFVNLQIILKMPIPYELNGCFN